MAEKPSTHFDYYRKAKSHENNGRYDEALKEYARALDVKEDYAHALFYKSRLHLQLGQYQDCVKCGERALELNPDWSDHIKKILDTAHSKM
ncbi:MAG: tetratricopeptide repeat protein [Candidatus Thorarchaeota archaeon]